MVDCCVIVYLTLRQQQDCGGGESKTTDRIGMVHVVHVEEMELGRGLGEKNRAVWAGLIIMGI